MNNTFYSVSEVNMHIKQLLDTDRALFDIYVKGELSNYKTYPSGHHYFTLKDEGGVLKAVMFRTEARRLMFRPENGMKVVVHGRIAVYQRDGVYQLYANEIIADGVGALHIAYEQLKSKLQKQGYFDALHKKPLPKYPQKICIITSSAGAAVQDMLRILKKRYPICEILLLPVRVQGEEAPGEISMAIKYANEHRLADLIITGRGGGSIEDLWAFNDEQVAQAIFDSDIPIISAVGHEPDFTISDFVADLRAATPSNAAELAVPDTEELHVRLKNYEARIFSLQERQLKLARQRLLQYQNSRVLQSPINYIHDRRMQLDSIHSLFISSAQRYLSLKKEKYASVAASLDAMSPLKVLGRGYVIAEKENGTAVKKISDVQPGDKLSLRLQKGKVICKVSETLKK